jgi:hypothetical protein
MSAKCVFVTVTLLAGIAPSGAFSKDLIKEEFLASEERFMERREKALALDAKGIERVGTFDAAIVGGITGGPVGAILGAAGDIINSAVDKANP